MTQHLTVFLTLTFIALAMVATPSRADVAVMLQITQAQVSVQRIVRQEPTEMDLSDEAIKRRSAEFPSKLQNPVEDMMLVEWLDAAGLVVHREVRKDPRFVHDPNGVAVVMPETVVLLRAPSSAVQLRVKPRGHGDFHEFEL